MCQPLQALDPTSSTSSSPGTLATSSSGTSTIKNSPPASSRLPSPLPLPVPLPLRPLPLQFISSNPDGTIPNPRTVRVHAIKEYHARKREAKRVVAERVGVQRRTRLKPRGHGAARDDKPAEDAAAAAGRRSDSNEGDDVEVEIGADGGEAGAAQGLVALRRRGAKLSPTTRVQHREDLVPYAWFDSSGPVLFVNRSKWPFPTPFHVTGSDRNDRRQKSLTPRQSHWMPSIRSPDYTVVKGAVLDQSVLSWIVQTTELFQFRVETIKWIQDQLNDPVGKGSNDTIGAIMTFTMWTAANGNSTEMNTHMDAIERIVNLRGGFLSFKADGSMTAKLASFDSIIAILTGQPTRFPLVSYFVTRPITSENASNSFHHESPLFGTGNFDDIITYPKDQSAIIALLKRMWNMTLDFEINSLQRAHVQHTHSPKTPSIVEVGSITPHIPSRTTPVLSFSKDPQHDYKTPLLTLPLLSSCSDVDGETSHNHVLDTLKSAAAIYTRTLSSTFQPTPSCSHVIDFSSPANDLSFTTLFTSFGACTTSDFWLRYPGLLIWVLLIGTAASRDKRECSWWMFYISRLGSFSSAERWEVGMEGVRRFLEIQAALRTAARRSEVP